MRSQAILVYLTGEDYAGLRALANAEERDPVQQARWILRCALASAGDQPLEEVPMAYINGPSGRNRASNARTIHAFAAGSPAVGAATAILAATASVAGSTVTAGLTQPDAARNVTATPGGTAGNVLAVSVIVNGTDINGKVLTETLPAFTAGAATAVTGVKAFKTITSIVLPTTGASTTIAVGTGAKLGLPYPSARDTVIAAFLNGVREATRPTFAGHATDPAQTTVTLNSTLNGTAVEIDYYEA